MGELGDLAKLWIYLKIGESLLGLIALPFGIWFALKIYKKKRLKKDG